jgi:hypothetical protein
MRWETVHSIVDFGDCPRTGIADFDGAPHGYAGVFDNERDEWSDRYWLTPVPPDLFALALEHEQIWQRWCEAVQAGTARRNRGCALPADRARRAELTALVGNKPFARTDESFLRQAQFRRRSRMLLITAVQWEVAWLPHAGDAGAFS